MIVGKSVGVMKMDCGSLVYSCHSKPRQCDSQEAKWNGIQPSVHLFMCFSLWDLSECLKKTPLTEFVAFIGRDNFSLTSYSSFFFLEDPFFFTFRSNTSLCWFGSSCFYEHICLKQHDRNLKIWKILKYCSCWSCLIKGGEKVATSIED